VNICIPIRTDEGLDSRVFAHFGSAPAFLLVDSETGECRTIGNRNQHHEHGMCSPLTSLLGERIDAVIVGGIGAGALGKLAAAGIPVHQARHATVRETVDAFVAGELPAVRPESACGHEGHGGHHHQRAHHHLPAGLGGL
jgi:predicted Fe-Mo cluster-binding NifX family protein